MNLLKTCTRCKQTLEYVFFSRRTASKDGMRPECKTCQRKEKWEYWRSNKAYRARTGIAARKAYDEKCHKLFDILATSGCIVCGEKDPVVLEFDHIDASTKKYAISAMLSGGYKWTTMASEIAKCQVMCANCHRRKTAKDNQWYKNRYKE